MIKSFIQFKISVCVNVCVEMILVATFQGQDMRKDNGQNELELIFYAFHSIQNFD